MPFTAIQLTFLQRLVSERPALRKHGAAAKFFCEHYSLGVSLRSGVEYRPEHFAAAELLLRNNDLPVVPLGPQAARSDAAGYGGMSEKTHSAPPHSRSVAVKCLGRCELDAHQLYTPAGAYIVLTPEQATRVSCQRVMLVENLETFRHLQAYAWIPRADLNVLAVYRGDAMLPIKDAAGVVAERREPIWGFFDFDPAGLAMANALPSERLEQLVLPPDNWLVQAANSARGRQLFDSQLASYIDVLDRAKHPQVSASWHLMKQLRSAVTQERMLGAARDVSG